MEKTQKLEFPPKWFNLQNYEKTKSFDGADWFQQLFPRHVLVYILFDENNFRKNKKEVKQAIDAFEEIKEKGLISSDYPVNDWFSFSNPYGDEYINTPIFPLNIGTAFVLASELDSIDVTRLYSMSNEEIQPNTIEQEKAIELCYTPYDKAIRNNSFALKQPNDIPDFLQSQNRNNLAHLVINLHASDKQILDKLKLVLKEYRELTKITGKSTFKRSDFKRWHEHRILQYIDLSLWAQIEGIYLKQNQYASAIFDDVFDQDCVEKVRKSTCPYALEAISYEAISALRFELEA